MWTVQFEYEHIYGYDRKDNDHFDNLNVALSSKRCAGELFFKITDDMIPQKA